MKKKMILCSLFALLAFGNTAFGHCQMPCGIYHDDMVFEMIDQYLETMYKAVTELSHISLNGTVKDKNQFIRWVIQKEKSSDETSLLITEYFLQQKIKPDEEDTAKKVVSAHKLLFLIVRIKQNADMECVKSFAEEWGKFKLFFHIEGYECEMEKRRLSQWEKIKEKVNTSPTGTSAQQSDHSHDHDHDHEPAKK